MKIIPIHWVAPDSLKTRIRALFHLKPAPKQSTKYIHYLNQSKNGACTTFGTAWAFQYNTWKKFENEYLINWAISKNWDKIWPWGQVTKVFAREHWGTSVEMFISSQEARFFLFNWYALCVSTLFPQNFYKQAIKHWIAFWSYEGIQFWHFMYLIQEWKDYFLINSWWNYVALWWFNKYQIDLQEAILLKYIRPLCFLVF